MMTRRPTPAEMGDEVTIAVVALTTPRDYFICVSDRMISHDDILPADDNALVKNLALSANWSVAFSATKIENALPLLDKVRQKIPLKKDISEEELQQHFTSLIADKIKNDFFNERISRYGYANMEDFRQEGLAQLGDHFFELCRELDKAEIGVEFIVYGYNSRLIPSLFEVTGKGNVIDRMALRYAVVGSGYWMASASLKRKPLTMHFDSMMYRTLEAKFSAETASGVGKRTTVTIKRPDLHDQILFPPEIEEFRKAWEAEMRQSESSEVLKLGEEIHKKLRLDEQAKQKLTGTG
jgi:hypothetical protein